MRTRTTTVRSLARPARAAVTLVALLVGSTAPLPAQRLAQARIGETLRLRLDDGRRVRGQVVARDADSLHLRLHPDTLMRAVALASVRSAELLIAQESRGALQRAWAARGARWGLLVGAGAALVSRCATGDDGTGVGDDTPSCSIAPTEVVGGAIVGSFVGLVLGYAIGSLRQVDHWMPVTVAPQVSGGGLRGATIGVRISAW